MQRYVIQVRDVFDGVRRSRRHIAVVELNLAAVMKAKLLGTWLVWADGGRDDIGMIDRRGCWRKTPLRASEHGLFQRLVQQWSVNPSGYAVARGEAETLCAKLNNQPASVDIKVSDHHLI